MELISNVDIRYDSFISDMRKLLQLYKSPEQDSIKREFIELLKTKEALNQENMVNGHITASAWIISPDKRKVLLTHHKKINKWLQLGGHVESDDYSIGAAALREATEESGISDLILCNSIFDLDIHAISERKNIPRHFHYDVRFLFFSKTLVFHISDESNNLMWVDLDSLKKMDIDESMQRMITKHEYMLLDGVDQYL